MKEDTLVLFHVAEYKFAFDVSRISGALAMQSILPAPELPKIAEGKIYIENRAVAVVDLRKRFGQESDAPRLFQRLLLCTVVSREGKEVEIAWRVDRVEQVGLFSRAKKILPARFVREDSAQVAEYAYEWKGHFWTKLRPEALLNDNDFLRLKLEKEVKK